MSADQVFEQSSVHGMLCSKC